MLRKSSIPRSGSSQSRNHLTLERLENRCLLSNTVSGGCLWTITGDIDRAHPDDNIVISLAPDDPTTLQAVVNDQVVRTCNESAVGSIRVIAGRGDDTVTIDLPEDHRPINVRLIGGRGSDILIGGAGNDLIRGGKGADILKGGAGSDILVGGSGPDTIEGNEGNDILIGNGGGDLLNGGPGNDLLRGGGDADTLDGGDQSDRFLTGPGADWIINPTEVDALRTDRQDIVISPSDPGLPDTTDPLARFTQSYVELAIARWEYLFASERSRPEFYDDPIGILWDDLGWRSTEVLVTGDLIASSIPDDYDSTNTQEQGVDEADLVKTDGEYLYLISDGQLTIFDAWPTEELSIVSQTDIEGDAQSLYLYDDHVMVISHVYPDWNEPVILTEVLRMPYIFEPEVTLTTIDVTDRENPQTVHEITLDGQLITSRAIDDRAYFVIEDYHWAPMPEFSYDDATGLYAYETEEQYRLKLELQADELLADVSHAHVIDDKLFGSSLLSVITFDIDSAVPEPVSTTRILGGDADNVYASLDNLYITEHAWDDDASDILKFSLGPDEVPLVAEGTVPGRVLNQFSMDEEDGYLRIATTSGGWRNRTNNVFVLEQVEDELNIVGSLTDIAPTEEIRSARFVGDMGYLVTFRITDPFFTFDLSNPLRPQMVGELHLPGFSSYLHPIEDDLIIGLGQDADENGRNRILQLSLFDVSDLADPTRIDTHTFADAPYAAYSEAQWDHHAFNYFGEEGILALPVLTHDDVTWELDELLRPDPQASLHVFQVSEDEGLSFLGQIEHDDSIRRSLRIEDGLYSISPEQVQVHTIDDPSDELASVQLDQPLT